MHVFKCNCNREDEDKSGDSDYEEIEFEIVTINKPVTFVAQASDDKDMSENITDVNMYRKDNIENAEDITEDLLTNENIVIKMHIDEKNEPEPYSLDTIAGYTNEDVESHNIRILQEISDDEDDSIFTDLMEASSISQSRAQEDYSHCDTSYNVIYIINKYLSYYEFPMDIIRKIFDYLQCNSMYSIIYKTKTYKDECTDCIFGCILTSHIMKFELFNYTNYDLILRRIGENYKNVSPVNEYDVPKKILIQSNNILAHYIAMIYYTLTDEEVVGLFNSWHGEDILEYCGSPFSMVLLNILLPDINSTNSKSYMLKLLLNTMYSTQNINPLYKIIEEMDIRILDNTIAEEFQIPPFLMEKLINICDINVVAKHQLYLDKSLITDHFDKLTEESLNAIIYHTHSMDDKLIDRVLKKYPKLIHSIIVNKLATIDLICSNVENISPDDWKFISTNYSIPDAKMLLLSKFLDWKLFISCYNRKNKDTDVSRINYIDLSWQDNIDLIRFGVHDGVEERIAEAIELGDTNL